MSDFKVSWFKILGMVGTLAEALTKAASDGKITLTEGVVILQTICDEIGVELGPDDGAE